MALLLSADTPGLETLKQPLRRWCYCALDVAVTSKLHSELWPRVQKDVNSWLYPFLLKLQGALLRSQLRGLRVDEAERLAQVELLKTEMEEQAALVNSLGQLAWGSKDKRGTLAGVLTGDGLSGKDAFMSALGSKLKPGNAPWRRLNAQWEAACLAGPTGEGAVSNTTLRRLAEYLELRPVLDRSSGNPTFGEEALATLGVRYPKLKPLFDAIVEYLALQKQLSFLEQPMRDNRLFTEYGVGATKTLRISCKRNCFGLGGNLQQIPQKRRTFIVADPGYQLFAADYQTAESHLVAGFSGDANYLAAHESGVDTHAFVAHLMLPNLPWPEDRTQWKKFASEYAWGSKGTLRQTFKTRQHAINYCQSAYAIAETEGIKRKEATAFMDAYFGTFPGIKAWHEEITEAVQLGEITVDVHGSGLQPYRRILHDRSLKDTVAHPPQSLLALIAHTAATRLAAFEVETAGWVQLLHHNHDELLFQIRFGREGLLPRVLELMRVPVVLRGREITLGVSCNAGNNWASAH